MTSFTVKSEQKMDRTSKQRKERDKTVHTFGRKSTLFCVHKEARYIDFIRLRVYKTNESKRNKQMNEPSNTTKQYTVDKNHTAMQITV